MNMPRRVGQAFAAALVFVKNLRPFFLGLALAIVVGPVTCLVEPVAYAADPEIKCEAAKLKAAGKFCVCRLKADSKARKNGIAADFTKCDEKFSTRWQKAETKFGAECPVTGDEATIGPQLVTHTVSIADQQAGPASSDDCAASKLKTTGKYCLCRFKADSKGVVKNVAPEFARCDEKLSKKWDKAEEKFGLDCPMPDDQAATETLVTSCVESTADDIAGSKTVFVTSAQYNGDLGGVVGADAICQAHADGAGLNGVYKAWVSVSGAGPSTTFTKSQVPYVQVQGSVVQANWDGLISGFLGAGGIRHDEFGISQGSGLPVWTGTTVTGDPALSSLTCNNWQAAGVVSGLQGHVGWANGKEWTDDVTATCDEVAHLYCFEQ